ncbi:MAG: hypothetical protein OHK0022_54190 [Roseiflexaceae bacterium]
MTTPNVQVVHDLYDAMKRGDLPAIFAQFAPNAKVIEPASLPYGGEFHGLAGLQQLFEQVFTVWEEFDATPTQILGEGDTVIALVSVRGKLRGVERPISTLVAEYWELRDGKVTLCQPFYADPALIAKLWAEREGVAA